LRTVSLHELSDALTSLDKSDESTEALGKASRAFERVRRGCIKVVARGKTTETNCESDTLRSAAQKWMASHLDVVEDVFQSTVVSVVS
jgi:hypothetical protein